MNGASAASERVTGRTAAVRPRTSKQLESVKHLLWHGNTEEALERIGGLNIEIDLLRAFSPPADKLGKSLGEFETYIRNNMGFFAYPRKKV